MSYALMYLSSMWVPHAIEYGWRLEDFTGAPSPLLPSGLWRSNSSLQVRWQVSLPRKSSPCPPVGFIGVDTYSGLKLKALQFTC